MNYHFLDYIKGGLNISLAVAIDFTGSNRIPTDPRSLHVYNPHQMNPYQSAIKFVGDILLNYDTDKMVPVYGFGAKKIINGVPENSANHCFPLTGDWEDTEVLGVAGIMSLYNMAIHNLRFSGPTFFAPCFEKIVNETKEEFRKNPDNYSIFLLLTDGVLHDMQKTIDVLVEASKLPISVVIVGIGSENFDNMRLLDDAKVTSSSGERPSRDVLQFVELQKCGHDFDLLTQEVLKEIPDQITSYYRSINRPPNPPISQSFNFVNFFL